MKTFRIKTKPASEESLIECRQNVLATVERCDFLFTDENVLAIYGKTMRKYFPDVPMYAMKAGEEHKTPQTLFELLHAMAAANLTRRSTIVCVGGGVVGDIGGLASALYMRGIACIQVPTTLLAQVDSSVGGKTAVDFDGVKNLVGVFRQPVKVLVDGKFLRTLPPREIRCGLGEIVKHGALCGDLFDLLWEHRENLFDLQFLTQVVPQNIAFKADVVKKDPKESGLRKCLNLGHTTAHAFELSDGVLSHGEYVLIGLIFETELSKRHCTCDEVFLEQLKQLALCALGGMPPLPPAGKAAQLAKLDKKNTTVGNVVATVPTKKGEYALLELPYEEYARELEEIQKKL